MSDWAVIRVAARAAVVRKEVLRIAGIWWRWRSWEKRPYLRLWTYIL